MTALHDLIAHHGPFVTVSAEIGQPTEDARQQLDARWTTIRHRLENEGVGQGLIEEIGRKLHERPSAPGPLRRTIVAADGEICFDDVQSGPIDAPEVVDVGPLPELSTWSSAAQRQVPFVLVVTDRVGADISFHAGLPGLEHEDVTVEGDDEYVTKVPDGDFAQKQFQQTAENTWRRNAEEVAETVRHGVREHRPEVVLIAGERRAMAELKEALDDLTVPVVTLEEGGRAAGSSDEALDQAVRLVLDEFEAGHEHDVLDRLAQGLGQGTTAACGFDAVLQAFVRGQVDEVVMDLDTVRASTIDPARYPGLPLPEEIAGDLPADRVLIAAAVATDAQVTTVQRSALPPEAREEGVAAVLRWDQ